eukprot:CAMPEP_0177539392 /NCGR_PEP_ID=MMETSP0369-20130122/58940_1 /TAXON_ID=447022 ORGANISM="Scrippsiella hangoei-like, Strain SHHI-4" /NCGR_SAMPLE_ID=MMETSP0369 /ASSEMBLY_ACC=CAM_ASM_000364 /LENGTH=89 /DNA_ID=CAMNT_0019022375 /DNA_START=127 /DNA_END=393 /DNA_ORIENTATION=-
MSGGIVEVVRLSQPLELGRRFDWILCLDVLAHISGKNQEVVLENLRLHAERGVVLSWPDGGDNDHGRSALQNAKPWGEARAAIEAAGFV